MAAPRRGSRTARVHPIGSAPVRDAPTLHGRALRLGAREVPLYCGAMHYWRLDPSAWGAGLSELQNLGLGIVETYVPWAVHEPEPGQLDFGRKDPRKDLGAFLDAAHARGLLAFVRPGPHINSEMTRFGLPEHIIHDTACQARSPNGHPVILAFPPLMFPVPSYASDAFHVQTGRWYDAVAEVVAPRLWPNGPVVLLQVDNEASYYFRNGPYCQDYHPDAIALWRQFVEARHQTLAHASQVHGRTYARWEDCSPPVAFAGATGEELALQLDWAAFHEHLITHALTRMRDRMTQSGLGGVPTVHNIALGEAGQPVSLPELERVVDLVGLDYYHARREHRTLHRRTLYLAGSSAFPFAPELGVGAPAWFTPLAHEDSLYCAMVALAYGLRGFNLYMAVDRDRWYGAPIDSNGVPRIEAGGWKKLLTRLHETRFHALERRVEVALLVPREYLRLSRATHTLGPISPSTLEAVGGSPVDACREDSLGFEGPIQILWWTMLGRFIDALTMQGVPFVLVDSDAPADRMTGIRVAIAPTFEIANSARWKRLCHLAAEGVHVVYGPAMPQVDDALRRHPFEVPRGGQRVLVDRVEDADDIVEKLIVDHTLRTPFRSRTDGIETSLHEDERGARVLFVINPTMESVEARIELDAPTRAVDALDDTPFSGVAELVVPMAPQKCRMLLLGRVAHGVAGVAERPRARRKKAAVS